LKIAVVGAGAMGSLFAGHLAEVEEDVWVYDVWEEHIQAIQEKGLKMIGPKGEKRIPLKATTNPSEPGIVDCVFLFVKYPYTRRAVQDAEAMIGPQTSVLSLQNGIGGVDIIGESIRQDQILFGLTTLTSELTGPGCIEESFKGEGETYFWPLNGEVSERVEHISAVFNKAGIHTKITPDVELRIWQKLIVNACQNSLTAITRLKVGDLTDQDASEDIFNGTIAEIVQVANRKGIPLDLEESLEFNRKISEQARDHYPSMLIDVKNKRKTEIDCLNGAVIREGQRLGVETPFNRVIYNIIRIVENSYEKQIS
jgi:2-dehydropantoate 2-reductase